MQVWGQRWGSLSLGGVGEGRGREPAEMALAAPGVEAAGRRSPLPPAPPLPPEPARVALRRTRGSWCCPLPGGGGPVCPKPPPRMLHGWTFPCRPFVPLGQGLLEASLGEMNHDKVCGAPPRAQRQGSVPVSRPEGSNLLPHLSRAAPGWPRGQLSLPSTEMFLWPLVWREGTDQEPLKSSGSAGPGGIRLYPCASGGPWATLHLLWRMGGWRHVGAALGRAAAVPPLHPEG